MKKSFYAVSLAFICLSFTANFAQSRSASPDSNNQKANKRPPQTQPSPTPQVVEDDDPNTTNIERIDTPADEDVIGIDTKLVTIPVKVSDKRGRFIGGLTREDFSVEEDKVPQEIAFFSNEEQPFTVALVLDMSYSSTFKINEIQSAAMAFIAQLRPNDKVMVVSFDEEVHVLTSPTNDREVLQRAIKTTKVASGTSLYEAIDLIFNQQFKRIKGRKAIVLFTDGVDTTSRRASDFSNERDASELDALVFPIQYDTYADVQAIKNKPVIIPPTQPSPIPSKNNSPFPFPIPTGGVGTPSSQGTSAEDYKRADEYLNEMANRTGGSLYKAGTTANLAAAFSNIANELRQFYSLGYYPGDEAQEGKRRKIKVRVSKAGLTVQARDGYVVGKQK
ncbi:MAG: VWA domain-containing protein [Acidobacteriota bacterium]